MRVSSDSNLHWRSIRRQLIYQWQPGMLRVEDAAIVGSIRHFSPLKPPKGVLLKPYLLIVYSGLDVYNDQANEKDAVSPINFSVVGESERPTSTSERHASSLPCNPIQAQMCTTTKLIRKTRSHQLIFLLWVSPSDLRARANVMLQASSTAPSLPCTLQYSNGVLSAQIVAALVPPAWASHPTVEVQNILRIF